MFIATTNGYTIQNGDTFVIANAGTLTAGTYTFNTTSASLGSAVDKGTGTDARAGSPPRRLR